MSTNRRPSHNVKSRAHSYIIAANNNNTGGTADQQRGDNNTRPPLSKVGSPCLRPNDSAKAAEMFSSLGPDDIEKDLSNMSSSKHYKSNKKGKKSKA